MIKIMQDKPCVVYSEKLDKTYTLYRTKVRLKNEPVQTIYYFSASKQREHNNMGFKVEQVTLPVGYQLVENPRNGFITIKYNEMEDKNE